MWRALCWLGLSLIPCGEEPRFVIEVVDAATGRGVPLVELKTTHNLRIWTDSAGVAVIDAPELFGREVYFWVSSHGYEYPADGFGMRGVRLKVEAGQTAKVELPRKNIAERLYRITGGGIYAESVRAGRKPPIDQPLLNAQVFGQDSVLTAVLGGKLYWFWGDTNRPSYPLGNFHTPGATSELPGQGGLDPDVGVNLHYFTDETGFAAKTAELPGEGPTWIGGVTTVRDPLGRERILASYAKVKPPMEIYERGIVAWDDASRRFQKQATFPRDVKAFPEGHPLWDPRQERPEYVEFCAPFPVIRVPADPAAWNDPERYEAFTPLKQGAAADADAIERDGTGKAVWGWKKATAFVSPFQLAAWRREGKLASKDARFVLEDAATGRPVALHGGQVCWNEHRKKYVMIAVQTFGETSLLGEVWYAEAADPLGPWSKAVKVVTHDRYSFYNPRQHPEFQKQSGKLIYFEGTYVTTFSREGDPTPRYDYNQIMYRLDVDDPRLAPARGEVISGGNPPAPALEQGR
jgi:hypothetical protein